MEMIEISPEKEEEEEKEETPVRSMFCLKRNMDLKSFDEKEDCFILDFNPFESLHLTHLSISNNHAEDLSVIAEKGQVYLYTIVFPAIAFFFFFGEVGNFDILLIGGLQGLPTFKTFVFEISI